MAEAEKSSVQFPTEDLKSRRVTLTTFDPSTHAKIFVESTQDHPELFHYFPFPPFPNTEDFVKFYTEIFIKHHQAVWAIYVNDEHGKPETMAGFICCGNTDAASSITELGLLIYPQFQRTFVTTNAVGILLQLTLDSPPQGMGFRRVQWTTHVDNAASRKAAERMGFRFEGVMRWCRVLPDGREGLVAKDGKNPGRHTAMLAICWDDWEDDRERIVKLMDR